MTMVMDNYEKATKIKNEILRLDYNNDLQALQDECGYVEGLVQEIFFWLEDENGDGYSVDECRLMYEL